MTSFEKVIRKYRDISFSERDKGSRFEKLMKAYLLTKPEYNGYFSDVWLWNEFPARKDFGGKDTGIDLAARTVNGDYWAVQCKCYDEHTAITKPMVDTFLSTSSKHFEDVNETGREVTFSMRLWIDTTVNNLNSEAENTLHNQNPPVKRINFTTLSEDPVDWEKLDEGISGKNAAVPRYGLRDHQKEAVDKAHGYLKDHDRGKLIMACGTGKTFTSLKIAENETDCSGLILFLVPSIALLGQSLNEWCAQADKPLHCLCICSDTKASETRNNSFDDSSGITTDDLPLPASTNIPNITKQYFRALEQQQKNGGMVVVFSTYQSIDVIMKVQRAINRERENSCIFDLIICDEAHRTTGITLKDEDESSFVKVHSNDNIQGKKRIYMTATPRLYTDDAQTKAKASEAVLCSMDDTALYGEEIYRIGFGEAVEKHLLSDYKVIVLTIGEEQMTDELQASIAGASEGEIKTDDALKLIGCINALSKITTGADKQLFTEVDPEKMHSAVAFCQNIKISKATKAAMNACREGYFTTLSDEEKENIVAVEADHVDGTMNSNTRKEKLLWLKAAQRGSRDCRILMNVRCLSEGVDVPSLDAVLFLSAKNSQIDVVQSVGRVMRRAPDKKYGYIIIPVVIPSNVEPEKVLDDNDRFKVVWTVLNALRAHDDRFNATINKIQLNKKKPDNIAVVSTNIGGRGSDTDETGSGDSTGKQAAVKSAIEQQLELQFEKLQSVIYAKMVKKCGSRGYWEAWAAEVAVIAQHHIIQINALIHSNAEAKAEFDKYMEGLHKNINPSISEEDAVEMLAQHIITQPVFEALFNNYSFVKNNPVSQSLQGIVGCLNDKIPPEENEKLQKFYKSVQESCSGIDNAQSRQEIIVELYNNFFKTAFPKIVEKMGIVYTPVEIVDFIINSVEKVLNKEFGRSMTDENVHILDPFTGTGTFITRLLQSGIIKPEDLNRKYTKEIHANEIVLLAYYIASINIENVYHELEEQYGNKEAAYAEQTETELQVASSDTTKTSNRFIHNITEAESNEIKYVPFEGICLTDTFQLGETEDGNETFSEMFPENSGRVIEQKKAPIRIIMGNPPYSIGQKSANDNAQNQSYPVLESRIQETYVAGSEAALNKSAYDSYIKAFRWASDRLGPDGGIIAYVSNGAWLDANGLDGFRKCLEKEFQKIYVYNLRGNQRTSGELSRKEGGKIFGSGSRTPIAITILVRKQQEKQKWLR